MNQLPTLFKLTSTGAKQQWEVLVDGNLIATKYGQVGGTITHSAWTSCIGKQGRTDKQQAEFEAKALWTKKLKSSGYVQSPESAKAGATDASVLGGEWPMLSAKYREKAAKIKWPVASQRKLNGHRCIAIVEQFKCTLWSRKRNQILSMPHIVKAIEALGISDAKFDGELFCAKLVEEKGLEALSHLVRSGGPVAGHEVIEYHIFDIPVAGATFRERLAVLGSLIRAPRLPLVLEETIELQDHDAALAWLEERMDEDGAEGIMLRNWDGLYKFSPTGRSDDLQKLKGVGNKYDDAEFVVVGVKEGKKGKMVGKAIFECITDAGVKFNAKMKGDLGKLKAYWEHPDRAIGRRVTVQFIGWSKKGKPWFPVVLQFHAPL